MICVASQGTDLVFWSGQTWSPGPTQKYFVFENQGSLYVTERAKSSAEKK